MVLVVVEVSVLVTVTAGSEQSVQLPEQAAKAALTARISSAYEMDFVVA